MDSALTGRNKCNSLYSSILLNALDYAAETSIFKLNQNKLHSCCVTALANFSGSDDVAIEYSVVALAQVSGIAFIRARACVCVSGMK